jgi:hypothetical protein
MSPSRLTLGLAALLAGCPTEEEERRPFDCALLHADGAALSEAPAEVVLGFQGLLHVAFVIAAEGGAPARVEAQLRFVPDEGEPVSTYQTNIPLERDETGGRSSESVLLVLGSGTGATWHGRAGRLEALVRDAKEECRFSAPLTLVDDDPCAEIDGPGDCEEAR